MTLRAMAFATGLALGVAGPAPAETAQPVAKPVPVAAPAARSPSERILAAYRASPERAAMLERLKQRYPGVSG